MGKEYTAEKAVRLFLESEVGDYSHFSDWKTQINHCHGDVFTVDVDWDGRETIEFRVDTSKVSIDDGEDDYTGDIEICIYEDNYEVTRTYDWTVKYFWMSLLRWD